MPPTETPPNSAPVVPPPPSPPPVKIVTRRFGEIDHTELVHLLDSLEGDQAKSRFRESIYISIIFYLILVLLVVFGPKYVFHTGKVVPSAAEQREKQRLTDLELNQNLAKELAKPKIPKVVPKLDQKALEAVRRATEAARQARAARPLPPAPTPAPAPPEVAKATPPPPAPLPPAPTPQPSRLPPAPAPSSNIPDAPRPSTSQPSQPSVAKDLSDMARQPSTGRLSGSGGIAGSASRVGQQGAGTGPVEILSDTRGVDFTDYIKRILRMIKAAWLPLIPEECYPPLSKEGTTLIHFTIAKNGALSQPMTLDGSTHDRAIDKAAWGAITGVAQFPPLPAAYTGDTLELRIQFIISRNPPSDSY